jgi:intracellular sulfur oxidation DsrE/DsrF family protein
MQNVIFHVDEMLKWGMVLRNVQNMITYYTQNEIQFHIEVVANGEAVAEYKKLGSKHSQTFNMLANNNVVFVACNNALVGLAIEREELFDFIAVVPAGVVELVEKQQQGYSYIKP